MAKIKVYSGNLCPYCTMAKKLLERKGLHYQEINVDSQPGLRQKLMNQTKRRTVPQIFVGDIHVGGFDDLYALEQTGKLDQLIESVCA